jgi:MFS family permease
MAVNRGAASRRAWDVLRHRDFRLLWSAELLSAGGSQMMRAALVWQLFELTRDPLQLGFLGLARFVPLLLFGLWGGVLADRGDRRRTLLLAQLLLLAASSGLAAAAFAGAIRPWTIYAFAVAAAVFGAVAAPTRQALIPALVPPSEMVGAMTLNGLAFQVGGVVGPALAGFLIAAVGVAPLFLFDAATFALVALALLAIRARPVVPPGGPRGLAAVREGLKFLWITPILLGIMGLDFLATFFGQSSVLMPIFADEVLGGGPRTLGLLLAAPAAGALLGSLVMAAGRMPRRPGCGILLAVATYGACILGFGLSGNLWLSLLLLAGGGAADAVSMALRYAVRNLVTPAALRGRIAAAHSTFAMGGPQLGEFESGVLAAALGAPAAVAIGGVGTLAATTLTAWRVPAIADFRFGGDPDLDPDPDLAAPAAATRPPGR